MTARKQYSAGHRGKEGGKYNIPLFFNFNLFSCLVLEIDNGEKKTPLQRAHLLFFIYNSTSSFGSVFLNLGFKVTTSFLVSLPVLKVLEYLGSRRYAQLQSEDRLDVLVSPVLASRLCRERLQGPGTPP